MGNIGKYHADYLLNGKVTRAQLTAVADALAPLAPWAAKGLRTFQDGGELIQSGAADAVLIATPHYQHTTLGVAALEAGLHVMVEKPVSVHKADAERLIAAHARHPKQVFAAMFQLRTEPRYLKMKKLISEGELGELVRVSWIITDWFRTEIYYASGGWRATWKGEGGGVLLNQCPHNLDILAWLCGMPARVRGFCQLGRYHQIEVEDAAHAILRFRNGALGIIEATTLAYPGFNEQLDFTGTAGTAIYEKGAGRVRWHLKEPKAEWVDQGEASSGAGSAMAISAGPHIAAYQDFAAAIRERRPPLVDGLEGRRSIELIQAIYRSSREGKTIRLG